MAALVMVLMAASVIVLAGDEAVEVEGTNACGENLTWSVDGANNLTISGTGAMHDYSPSESSPWGKEIKTVTIESGVTTIGDYAFYQCTALKEVYMGSGVVTIGEYAFNSCTSLITIGLSSTQTIGDYAFDHCTSLVSIDISRATTIGEGAFTGCGLTSIAFANEVTIGNGAFTYCFALTRIVFPDSITDTWSTGPAFGSHTFYETASYDRVLYQTGVSDFQGYTFEGTDYKHMVRQGGGSSSDPVDPTDPDTDGGSDSPTFIPLPDNRGDDFPGYVPVPETGSSSDGSSAQVAVIVGAIAVILAIMAVLLYRKD